MDSENIEKIRVLVRVRPPNRIDGPECVTTIGQTPGEVVIRHTRPALSTSYSSASAFDDNPSSPTSPGMETSERTHCFDTVFSQATDQAAVYQVVAAPLVSDLINGINSTILVYGQTASGKTHTMVGPQGGNPKCCDPRSPLYPQRGIMPRMLEDLFEQLPPQSSDSGWVVKMQYFELYNEKFRDLLADNPEFSDSIRLREDILSGRGVYVDGVTEINVSSGQDAANVMGHALARRAIAATAMNQTSSRSHVVLSILVDIRSLGISSSAPGLRRSHSAVTRTTARLNLVDLAGSEKVSKTLAQGQHLKEAQRINLSLTLLGNVIYRLSEPGVHTHIPYRDSKLTRVLQESLGGNSRTALVCCIAPGSHHASESTSTLYFAARAKLIETRPRQNREMSYGELQSAYYKLLSENQMMKQMAAQGNKHLAGAMRPRSAATDSERLRETIAYLQRENGELKRELIDRDESLARLDTVAAHRLEMLQHARAALASIGIRVPDDISLLFGGSFAPLQALHLENGSKEDAIAALTTRVSHAEAEAAAASHERMLALDDMELLQDQLDVYRRRVDELTRAAAAAGSERDAARALADSFADEAATMGRYAASLETAPTLTSDVVERCTEQVLLFMDEIASIEHDLFTAAGLTITIDTRVDLCESLVNRLAELARAVTEVIDTVSANPLRDRTADSQRKTALQQAVGLTGRIDYLTRRLKDLAVRHHIDLSPHASALQVLESIHIPPPPQRQAHTQNSVTTNRPPSARPALFERSMAATDRKEAGTAAAADSSPVRSQGKNYMNPNIPPPPPMPTTVPFPYSSSAYGVAPLPVDLAGSLRHQPPIFGGLPARNSSSREKKVSAVHSSQTKSKRRVSRVKKY